MARTSAAKEPVKLKPLHAVLVTLALPLFLALFVVGAVGLHVLTDESGTSPVTLSQFGQLYKALIAKNPFFSAAFFNGGMIGSIFCVVKLLERRKAIKAEKAKALEEAAAKESKKTK